MNRKQIIVLWVGLSIILLMGIFPPWLRTFSGGGAYSYTDANYKFILTPPEPDDTYQNLRGIKLDVCRLCVQWVVVSVVTGGLILTFRDKKKT